MFTSYKKQTNYFQRKLIDWFLHDGKIGCQWADRHLAEDRRENPKK